MTHPFAMMLAQFQKLADHSSKLTAELDHTAPGEPMIRKLAELKSTLAHVEKTTKLMTEMADVYERFAKEQIIGPAGVRIAEADYRRLAGLDQPTVLDWMQGNTALHEPYVEPEYNMRKATLDEENMAVRRANTLYGRVGRTRLPDNNADDNAEIIQEMIRAGRAKVMDTDQGRVTAPVGADEEEGETLEEIAAAANEAIEQGEIPTVEINLTEVAVKAESRELNVDVPDEIARGWFKFNG